MNKDRVLLCTSSFLVDLSRGIAGCNCSMEHLIRFASIFIRLSAPLCRLKAGAACRTGHAQFLHLHRTKGAELAHSFQQLMQWMGPHRLGQLRRLQRGAPMRLSRLGPLRREPPPAAHLSSLPVQLLRQYEPLHNSSSTSIACGKIR